MHIKEKIKILMVVVLLSIACIGAYQNREPVCKWWKRQVIEFKLLMLKQQFLDLQQKYGPEGAIDA